MAWVRKENREIPNSGGVYLEVWYEVGNQSIESNFTPMRWEIGLRSTGSRWNADANSSLNQTIYGESYSSSFAYDFRSTDYIVLDSWSWRNVGHNDNGTKTVYYDISVSLVNPLGNGSVRAQGSVVLKTIPRKSSLSSYPSVYSIGDVLSLRIEAKHSSFRHNVYVMYENSDSSTDYWLQQKNIGAGLVTFNVTESQKNSLLNRMPTVSSRKMYLWLTTLNASGNRIGYNVYTITVNIKEADNKITVSGFQLSEANALVKNGFLQHNSQIRYAYKPNAPIGTSVKSTSIQIEGKNYSNTSGVTGVLLKSGLKQKAIITVETKRNRKASFEYLYDVKPYTYPSVQNLSQTRTDSVGNPATLGTYIHIKGALKFTQLGYNKLRVRILKNSVSQAENTYTLNGSLDRLLSGFLVHEQYALTVELFDGLKTVTYPLFIPTSNVTMSWNETSVGIGMVVNESDKDLLRVKGNIYQRESVQVLDTETGRRRYPIGVGVINFNDYYNDGDYLISSNANASKSYNAPCPYAGIFRVRTLGAGQYPNKNAPWMYVMQNYLDLNGVEYQRSMMTDGNGVWNFGKWRTVLSVEEEKLNGEGGYVKHQSGRLEVWGRVRIDIQAKSRGSAVVRFPISFIDTKYTVITSVNTTAPDVQEHVSFEPDSSSQMTLYTYRTTSNWIWAHYHVIGRWK